MNSGRVYGGAATRIIPPITAADCTRFPAFEPLVVEEHKAGRGCTVRQGRAWAARTVEEIEFSCTPQVPVLTYHMPPQWTVGEPATVGGHEFYDEPGVVYLGNAALWTEVTHAKVQEIGTWMETEIVVSAVVWDMAPSLAWIYVKNKWELVNPVGRLVEVLPAP